MCFMEAPGRPEGGSERYTGEGTAELCPPGRWGLDWVMLPANARNFRYWGTSSKELAVASPQSFTCFPQDSPFSQAGLEGMAVPASVP